MVRRMGAAAAAVIVLVLTGCVSENKPAGGTPAATGSGGETLSKQALSRKFLDACVYGQARVKDIERQSMIEKCRCSSDNAMKAMGDGATAAPRSGGFTPAQNEALKSGIAACFKTDA